MAIEDILMGDETLFNNINAFNPDYMPENFNFRDSQMEGMAMCIRPAIQGGRPTNSVIMGSCATGKTTALKKVFELVERNTDKVVCCYINCQLHTTHFGIFSQIHKKIFRTATYCHRCFPNKLLYQHSDRAYMVKWQRENIHRLYQFWLIQRADRMI